MKILWVIGILIIFAVSCINRVNSYYWEETGDFKTNIVYFSQYLRTVNDSDILEQVYLNKKTLRFVFGKSLKNEVYVQGFRRPNPPPQVWEPQPMCITFISDTIICLSQQNFEVIKYRFHPENTEDGDAYYYWVPGVGIIKIKSADWNIKQILHATDPIKDMQISKLNHAIKGW